MVVKTFRGLLADEGQDQIRLGTNKGKVGYRIVKFQLIGNDPGITYRESVVKIFKNLQTSVTATIDLTDSDLLAASFYSSRSDVYAAKETVIFDNQIINQDIYVTYKDAADATAANYYLELEVIPLTDHAAEYATLKDIRTQRTIT